MSNEIPPPPTAENTMQRQGDPPKGAGLTLRPEMVIDLAKMYTNYRPIIGLAARMMKQKIPRELDEAMRAVAASGDPEALRRLQQEEEQGQNRPALTGPPGSFEVPPDASGSPVMTEDMAEEAYFLNQPRPYGKGMGTAEIAQYFTERGSPVSKATVIRYIDDMKHRFEEEEILAKTARTRRIELAALTVFLWFGSALGLHYLFDFLHLF